MRKSKVRDIVVALIVLAIALFFIAGTYARYSSSATVNGTVQVAKWQVKLDDTDISTTTTTKNITFTVQSNTNVVDGKIAPAVTATAEVELDLTGTEVAVDFDATIDPNFDLTTVGASGDKLTLTTKVDGTAYTSGTVQTISLPNGSAFTAANGKKTVTLELTWTNDDTNNADDSTMGNAAPTITIPVTLTAQQHI